MRLPEPLRGVMKALSRTSLSPGHRQTSPAGGEAGAGASYLCPVHMLKEDNRAKSTAWGLHLSQDTEDYLKGIVSVPPRTVAAYGMGQELE